MPHPSSLKRPTWFRKSYPSSTPSSVASKRSEALSSEGAVARVAARQIHGRAASNTASGRVDGQAAWLAGGGRPTYRPGALRIWAIGRPRGSTGMGRPGRAARPAHRLADQGRAAEGDVRWPGLAWGRQARRALARRRAPGGCPARVALAGEPPDRATRRNSGERGRDRITRGELRGFVGGTPRRVLPVRARWGLRVPRRQYRRRGVGLPHTRA